MYDIKWIREHPDAFDQGLKRRGLEPLSKKLLTLDEKRRAAITRFEQAQARRNAASKEIGDAKKVKDKAKSSKLMAEVAELKNALPAMEEEQKSLAAELEGELARIPNARAEMSSATYSARSASIHSSQNSILIWAKRLARWISNLRPNCPARDLSSCRKVWRVLSVRWASSCWICIRERSTTTLRLILQSSCAMK
jgi:hypothetical protein